MVMGLLRVQMETNLGDFADILGEAEEAGSFRAAAAARKQAINTLLWNQTSGGKRTLPTLPLHLSPPPRQSSLLN